MRVVLITNIPAPYFVDLVYYMQSNLKQYDIHVIYTSRNEDNREWEVDENKLVNTIILDSKVLKVNTGNDNRYIHVPANISRCLNQLQPDIVIAWEYNLASMQALFWCKMCKKKFISLTEGTLNSEKNLWLVQKITRKIIAKQADGFLASGTKAKEKLLSWGIPAEKIFIEYLTVDTMPFICAESMPETGRILYVGSMAKRKGLDLLIDALPFVQKDYELRIVGNGSAEDIEKLKERAVKKKVADKITWLGFKTGQDLVREYQCAEVFVLPTREDCFGLVLLEALSARVPIVASKYADGAYDIVETGINGYIVDPYHAEEMAEALSDLLNNDKIRRTVHNYNSMIVEKFSFENVAKGFVAAIEYVERIY